MTESKQDLKRNYTKNDAMQAVRVTLNSAHADTDLLSRFSDGRREERVEGHRYLLNYYVDNVLNGEADTKLYAFDIYKDLCDKYEAELELPLIGLPQEPFYIELQHFIQRMLPKQAISKFFEELPKGMQVSIFESKFLDGRSTSSFDWMQKLVENHLIIATLPGEEEPDLVSAFSERGSQFLDLVSPTRASGRFIVRTDAWIQTEAMQQYSKGSVSVIDLHDTETKNIIPDDVIGFVIHGTDHALGQRREREIYPGRPVQIWNNDLHAWIQGKFDSDTQMGGMVRVNYESPQSVINFFGEESVIDFQYVKIGNNSNVRLGYSNFEQFPELFSEIDLSLLKSENPYEHIPENCRPGALVQLTDGRIGQIEMVSGPGFSVLAIETSGNNFVVPWDDLVQMSLLTENEVPDFEYDEFVQSGVRKKVVKIAGNPDLYKQIKGIYNIDGTPRVILETLPVKVGSNANLSDFIFEHIDVDTFWNYINNGQFILPDESAMARIEARLPEFAEIRKLLINKHASLNCTVTFNGRMPSDKHIVYFHTLPWGVWVTKYFKPELIPIENIESIQDFEIELP